MKYAVNLSDLHGISKIDRFVIVECMIKPITPTLVRAEKTVDGTALLLEGNEERNKAIVDVIRMKFPKHKLRCYESKTGRGGWKRV